MKAARGKMSGKFLIILSMMLVAVLFMTTAFAYAGTSVSKYTGTTYTHNSIFDNCILVNGIDVSAYQGNIDWAKVKADGIDYAIIKVAGRGYGSAGTMYSDGYFEQNIRGAKEAGLMVGIYFFSQAITEFEAIAEAKYAIELLGEYDLDLPIFMDYEFAGSQGRLTTAGLSKIKATNIAKAFCKTVTDMGYNAGVYANITFLTKTIDGGTLGEKYPIWAAQYYSRCQYNDVYNIWQYTSSGSINGISGKVDTNFMYLDPNPAATTGLSIADANAYIIDNTSYTYNSGQVYQPNVSVSLSGIPLVEGLDYKVRYINNTQAGTAYAMVMGIGSYSDYKLVPFEIRPNDNLSGISVAAIASRTYTGKETKPSSITVTDSKGNKLDQNVDYTWSVSNATQVGTASVTISFMGNYSGSKTVTYKIVKAAQTITVADARTQASVEDVSYNLGVSLKFPEDKVSYSSSDKNVATVSSSGKVTLVGQGTTTIKISTSGTANVSAATKSVNLTVTKPAQKITAKYTKYSKDIDAPDFNLAGVATDGDGALKYSSSDETVVTVSDEGKVSVAGPGTATITVTAEETAKYRAATLDITVTVEKIQQNVSTSYTRYKRKELDSMFSLKAATDGDGELSYISDDESIATVDEKGRVAITGPGVVTITVVAGETEKYLEGSKTVTITVSELTEEEKTAKIEKLTNGVESTEIINLKAAAERKKVKLTWKKSSSGYSVDYYQIWRSYKKSSGYKKMFNTSNSTSLYYTNTKSISPNTTYWYKVRGVRNIAGDLVYTPFTKVSTKTLK